MHLPWHGMDACSEAFGYEQRFRFHVGNVVGLYDSIVTCIAICTRLFSIPILRILNVGPYFEITERDLSESEGAMHDSTSPVSQNASNATLTDQAFPLLR